MATRFQSTETRGFWSGIAFAVATDFLVAIIIIRLFFAERLNEAILPSIATILAIYAVQIVYSAIGAARYWLVFTMFEKDARVDGLVDLMRLNGFPKPSEFYSDPDAYLEEVASSDEVNGKAKFIAGAMSGTLSAFSIANRPVMKIATYVALEKALNRYSREFGD